MTASPPADGEGLGPEESAALEAAADVLALEGPADVTSVVARLRATGHDLGVERLEGLLLGVHGPHRLADGRLADLAELVNGLVLTHRLTAEEMTAGAVVTNPDLSALILIADRGLRVIGGSQLAFGADDAGETRLRGPEGWLQAADAGDLVAVTVVGHLLSVMIGGESRDELGESYASRLRDTVYALRDLGRRRVELPDLVIEARARDPELLSLPGPPLAEILPQAHLRVADSQVYLAEESAG